MSMNALKRLDCKQLIVFAGTLMLGLVSFFTLLPDSKALPDNNFNSKLNKLPVFPETGTMAPTAPVKGQEMPPRFLKVRPECDDSIPPTGGRNHA